MAVGLSLNAQDTKSIYRADGIDYIVPMTRYLAKTNEWHPASQKLPCDLHHLANLAHQHLKATQSIKSEVALVATAIDSIKQPSSTFSYENPVYIERWVVTLYFQSDRATERHLVVMLFDGTIADERKIAD